MILIPCSVQLSIKKVLHVYPRSQTILNFKENWQVARQRKTVCTACINSVLQLVSKENTFASRISLWFISTALK